MDPDLSMIREEGGERSEAGAVRDELDNQARHLRKIAKVFEIFQRLTKIIKDLQR